MSNIASIHHQITEILPDLTLGELLSLFLILDSELNARLRLLPISDTLDLRSYHVRKEVHSFEHEKVLQSDG